VFNVVGRKKQREKQSKKRRIKTADYVNNFVLSPSELNDFVDCSIDDEYVNRTKRRFSSTMSTSSCSSSSTLLCDEQVSKRSKRAENTKRDDMLVVANKQYSFDTFKSLRRTNYLKELNELKTKSNNQQMSKQKANMKKSQMLKVLSKSAQQIKLMRKAACKSHIQRSRSSSTSSSSWFDNERENFNRAPTPATSSYHRQSTNDLFDINNIVLPHNIKLNTIKSVYLPKSIDVTTPKWRVVCIESTVHTSEMVASQEEPSSDELENIQDLEFIRRHELAELKERFNHLYKKLKTDLKHNKHKTAHVDAANLIDSISDLSDDSNIKCVNEFRTLVNRLELELYQTTKKE